MKTLNVGIVGYKFMGKAHSNGWKQAPLFFDLDVQPVLKVCLRQAPGVPEGFCGQVGMGAYRKRLEEDGAPR